MVGCDSTNNIAGRGVLQYAPTDPQYAPTEPEGEPWCI
jgi:hypothetical protein